MIKKLTEAICGFGLPTKEGTVLFARRCGLNDAYFSQIMYSRRERIRDTTGAIIACGMYERINAIECPEQRAAELRQVEEAVSETLAQYGIELGEDRSLKALTVAMYAALMMELVVSRDVFDVEFGSQ